MKKIKKYFLITFGLFALIGCSNLDYSNKTNKNNDIKEFVIGESIGIEQKYGGGFENAGYSVLSEVFEVDGNTFIVETTKDTATIVERVYIVLEDRIELLSTLEDSKADLKNIDLENGEIVLKKPFKIGATWESKGNKYKILTMSENYILIEKTFPSGIVENITYKKGFGKIKGVIH